MKTYSGVRTENGCAVTVVDAGDCRGLDPRLDLRTHSPAGFEWGYGGSGPAQLALALAADVLGDDEEALGVYQRLKFRVVGHLPADGTDWVYEVVRRLAAEAAADEPPTEALPHG